MGHDQQQVLVRQQAQVSWWQGTVGGEAVGHDQQQVLVRQQAQVSWWQTFPQLVKLTD